MLSDAQVSAFDRDGFLVVDRVLSDADREPIFAEYQALVDTVAKVRGHTSVDWAALSFEQRITQLLSKDPAAYEFLDISLPLREGLDESAGMHAGPAVFSLLTHPKILDIVESVVGPELVSNPVQHVRIKPPESALNAEGRGNSNMSRTGWHQDAAVVLQDAEESPILTVWVAMTDATTQMGCMQAVPGSHRWASLGKHCPGRAGVGEIFIPPELVDAHPQVDLSVKAGGVVLLNKKTWHGAGPNNSDRIRWSFDLRYQPPGHTTGRECFPAFLARSVAQPNHVLQNANEWAESWQRARTEISAGKRDAVFNERWRRYRNDPMCA